MAVRSTLLIPIIVIVLLITGFLQIRPFSGLTESTPPTEDIVFETVRLDETGIHARLRVAGSEPVTVAQVQVDGAYWSFSMTSEQPVSHLGRTRIDVPYPWIEGETHVLTIVTSTGVTFDHEIAVALGDNALSGTGILQLIGIGLFVGFIPILVGYGFMPGIRAFGSAGTEFALALTLALLVFLLIDTWGEAMEFAAQASGALNARLAVWSTAIVTCLLLLSIGRRGGSAPEGLRLAFFVALGIGIHNMGEGIAIGVSVAVGEAALASYLALGFFLHNLTEGVAIAAPLKEGHKPYGLLVALALLAGGPAAVGTVAGAFAVSPFSAAIAFAIGAGAIFQVLIEVGGMFLRRRATGVQVWADKPALSGFGFGLVVMYMTSVLVSG